jgi:hypothetical protein
MDHCVQLVGYNQAPTDGSPPFWIVRNQWGQGFGEAGFIRLQLGNNTCGIDNEVTFVNDARYLGSIPIPVPTPPKPKPSPTPTPKPSPLPSPCPREMALAD